MAARGTRKDAISTRPPCVLVVCKGQSNDDVGVARDTVFREIRPGAGFNAGDFVKRKRGGGGLDRRTTREYHVMSRSAVAPPSFLRRNRRFQNQLPVVSPETRCPSTPRCRRSLDLCPQEMIWMLFFFNSILHCVEQP